MTNVVRLGLCRVFNSGKPSLLHKAALGDVTQKCGISGKTLHGESRPPKPAPWPYKQKKYGMLSAMFDRTSPRLDENSKVIVVDGPIAAGKSAFAKQLADELEMLYVPEANMDMHYINPYGYDMRQLDPKLPASCRSFDTKSFCLDPKHKSVANFQIQMYTLRFSQYFDALAHVLNTGQGVVLDRCVFSDFVFLEAMYKAGYISKGARSVYHDIRKNTIGELMKPHLVVYLDVSVETIKSRIQQRAIDYELKSKVFTDEYLGHMEHVYKQQYLKEISSHAHLLIYNWTSFGDTEVVVEDIERVNFNRFDEHDPKMRDWRLYKEWDWAQKRIRYTSEKPQVMNYFNVPRFDVPELLIDPYDAKALKHLWLSAPGMEYRFGYNEQMGDTGILMKTAVDNRDGK